MRGSNESDQQEFQICDREKTHKLLKSSKDKKQTWNNILHI